MSLRQRKTLVDDTERILHGRFSLLGQEWAAEARTDWALDPNGGYRWPWNTFCFDYSLHEGFVADPRLVQELSRLQHLQVLAEAAALGNGEAHDACIEDLQSWFQGNPPFNGLAWLNGIDLACRVVSLLVISGLLGNISYPDDLRETLWRSLAAHGAWLARYPSLYSSANNHLVAEAGGLFILGSLAPRLPGAGRWRRMGQDLLLREIDKQFHPDGVGWEQSPSYQAFSMEWYLLARHVALATHSPWPSALDDGLANGAGFLCSILDRAGNHPRLGDDDEGRVLRPSLSDERYVLAIAGLTATALHRPELLHSAWEPDLRHLLMDAPLLGASAYCPRSRCFEVGGYTILHAGLGESERLLVMDHGPLGAGPIAAHGHADALSVCLHIDGQPILVDSGTFRYHNDEGWRTWMRGTEAHNTVTVDGSWQSEMTGPFNWGRRPIVRMDHLRLSEKNPRVEASHDAYMARHGVAHRRAAMLDGMTGAQISDHIDGIGRHTIRISFQFAPGLVLVPTGPLKWNVMRGGERLLRVTQRGPRLEARIVEQIDKPGPGAVSLAYNHLNPAPALVFEGEVTLPATWTTAFTFERVSNP